MNKSPNYIFSADVIRVIAILGVVIIHTVNAVYTRVDFFGGFTWWIAIALDTFSRISIPLFIMLSGFLILGKNESFEKSIKRLFVKILIPLVFWMLFYMWYGGGIPFLSSITPEIFVRMFYADVYHLYFLVILLGLYFIAPLIRSYIHSVSAVSQHYFMNLLLVIGLSMVGLQFIFGSCMNENFFTRWIPYTGIFVAGYLLGNRREKFNNNKLLMIYFPMLLVTFGLNYVNYFLLTQKIDIFNAAGCLAHYSDHYLSINVFLMSLTAFLLLLNLQYKKIKSSAFAGNFVHSWARASFGIYLLHPFVARFLEMQFHLAIDFSSLPIPIIIFSRLFLILILSYLITVILSKIPIVKSLVGAGK